MYICREVVQGQIAASAAEGQALFNATGFRGVSDPDDKEDVDDGDIRDVLVVSPSGIPTAPLELDVAATKLALVSTEVRDAGTAGWPTPLEFCCAAAKLAPIVRWYVSSSVASGEPPLAPAKC